MVVAPRSETEHAVAAMWSEAGLRATSIDDEFLDVGGNPDRAMTLIGRFFDRWRVKITIEDFLAASSIARLSATIDRKKAEARTHENDLLSEALKGLDSFDGSLD